MKVSSKLMGVMMGLALATASQAATYQVIGNVVEAYDTAFNPISADVSANTGVAGIYKIDFQVKVSDLGAGQRGFGNVVFSINLSGDSLTQYVDLPGWQALTSMTDTNGAAPGGGIALFSTNADFGANATDLKDIFVGIANVANPTATDMRAKVGQEVGPTAYTASISPTPVNATGFVGGWTTLGSVWVNWDGVGPETLSIDVTQASYASTNLGVMVTDTTTGTLVDSSVTFGAAIPEPASLGLLAIGGLMTLARRRRA